MATITRVRPVLLSAPYAEPKGNLEVLLHLPGGWRTTGLVEITLDNGVVGLGEGYLAVFAPGVFRALVELLAPVVVGRDPTELSGILRALQITTGYWSLQGAAQHVVSAFEIALQDCRAQLLDVPLWKALGGQAGRPLRVYASGGDSINPDFMHRELQEVAGMGIDMLKIRARKHQADKVAWCQREGAKANIAIAVDMTQNLAVPSQSVEDILTFVRDVVEAGGRPPVFLEEVLGPYLVPSLPALRRQLALPIAGGEIVTTAWELCERLRAGYYDIVQPDATVLGGIGPVLEVFSAAGDCQVYVHCWGAGVGMLANYHAAVAGGGKVVEWPLPAYPLRQALMREPLRVVDGRLSLPDLPGLGVRLTPQIEREFQFREEAVYRCLVDPSLVPAAIWK